MTSLNSAGVGKRDLHVGGVGIRSRIEQHGLSDQDLSAVADLSETVLRQARRAVQSADDYVHDHPWSAIGVVALVSLATGFLVSRRY